MNIKNVVLAGVILLGMQQVMFASQGALKDKVKDKMTAVKAAAPTASSKKAVPVAKKALKLSPTTTKARVFFSDETKEISGVEVIVCQGDCSGRTSMPYEKDMKEIQAKAEKIAQEALAKEAK